MGRTQHTYRMRVQSVREQLIRIMRDLHDKKSMELYHHVWEQSYNLAAPASAFPWPDTKAVVTFTMLLDIICRLGELELELGLKPLRSSL